jgi:tetratricopeptide (TPR) repeat protein
MAAAHFNRGAALEQLDDVKGARSAYEQAVALEPNYVDALASLAWLDAVAGDAPSARSCAQRALALSASDVLARMALASADLQQREFDAAGAGLGALIRDPALTRLNRAIVAGLIGDLKDAQGQVGQAFAAYQACNAEIRAMNVERFEAPGTETALARARRLSAWFESAGPEQWRDAPPVGEDAGSPREHIFLVGFPRSGTTLLENVLAAHPDVVALEEKDCLGAAERAYLDSDEGLRRLVAIGVREAEHHRALYWSEVRRFGVEPKGRVFIDKLPLATVLLPVIAKLFPTARVLFALRDPRDVVLSCFRRRFALNPAMYELLTLPGAATYYDAVMRLSERYRDLLPLPQVTVRYEKLVEDFEGTARATCAFLGLHWDESMLDFAAKARTRGIATPSAAQVTRGLNRDGQGVWRRYREQMAPVLPILEPWVERFGYDTAA